MEESSAPHFLGDDEGFLVREKSALLQERASVSEQSGAIFRQSLKADLDLAPVWEVPRHIARDVESMYADVER